MYFHIFSRLVFIAYQKPRTRSSNRPTKAPIDKGQNFLYSTKKQAIDHKLWEIYQNLTGNFKHFSFFEHCKNNMNLHKTIWESSQKATTKDIKSMKRKGNFPDCSDAPWQWGSQAAAVSSLLLPTWDFF